MSTEKRNIPPWAGFDGLPHAGGLPYCLSPFFGNRDMMFEYLFATPDTDRQHNQHRPLSWLLTELASKFISEALRPKVGGSA